MINVSPNTSTTQVISNDQRDMEGTKTFHGNLNVLESVQPQLTKCLCTETWPDNAFFAVGRDGTRTVRLMEPDGRLRWFGASSMPTVSASALLEGFQHSGGNVCTPGVLTGLEPLLLVQSLPQHCAVFVVEENMTAILIALHLYDYQEAIAAGRLVFLWGSDWHTVAMEFVSENPGYLMPSTLLTPPQRSSADIAVLQRRMEELAQEIGAVHQRLLAEQIARLRNRTTHRAIPPNPRVAVVGTDAAPWMVEQAKRLDRALNSLGWEHAVCVPDSPKRCHLVARLRAIESSGADIVINLSEAASLEPFLPKSIRRVEWQALCPGFLAADVAMAERPTPAQTVTRPRPDTVAVVMDVVDARPATLGISLSSHLALWEQLHVVTRQALDRHLDLSINSLLSDAVTQSGTSMTDPAVREQFMRLTRECLVPWVLAESVADALQDPGLKTEFFGANWSTVPNVDFLDRSFPMGLERVDLLQRTQCFVLPDPSPRFAEFALDALATGKPVVLRTTQERFAQHYTDLEELSPFLYFYTRPAELRAIVSRVLSGDSTVAQRTAAARSIVLERHTVAHRLEKLRVHLTKEQIPCGPF